MKRITILSAILASALALGACGSSQESSSDESDMSSSSATAMHDAEHEAAHAAHAAEAAMQESATAVVRATSGHQIEGVVHFEQVADGVRVRATLHNLMPNSTHGFHIHEVGDCSAPDGTSAGGHYNPEGHDHGGPDSADRHAGDLGNIESDSGGNATLDMTVSNVTLHGAMNPIVGRSVIVHEGNDDLVSQPTGAAGARIGCGVIELDGMHE